MNVGEKLLARAKERASSRCEPMYIVETDAGEDRESFVADRRYVDSDEFEAFDGRILAIAYPDGDVEL